MAEYELVKYFRDQAVMVPQMETKRISRADLGTLGMPQIVEQVAEISRQLQLIVPYADAMGNSLLREAKVRYQGYLSLVSQIGGMSVSDFSARHLDLERSLEEEWGKVMQVWSQLAAIVANKNGMLWNAASLQTDLTKNSQETLTEIRDVGSKIIAEAKQYAAAIESGARKTATVISVAAAQTEFNAAQVSLRQKAVGWSAMSAVSFGILFWFAYSLYNKPLGVVVGDKSTMLPELIFHAVLRLTILTGIGAIATFMLRMTRAHIHMLEYNAHRTRVANSMSAFVAAASTDDQRDLILGKLVTAVVEFGDSGILEKEKDSVNVPSVAIDALTKNFGTSK